MSGSKDYNTGYSFGRKLLVFYYNPRINKSNCFAVNTSPCKRLELQVNLKES